jgi:hypothetical protein
MPLDKQQFLKSLMTETEDILPQEGQVHGQRKHTAGILIFSGRFPDRNNSKKSFVRRPLKGLSVTKGCYTWKSYPLAPNKSMFKYMTLLPTADVRCP